METLGVKDEIYIGQCNTFCTQRNVWLRLNEGKVMIMHGGPS